MSPCQGHILHNNQGGCRVVRAVIIGENGRAYSSTIGIGANYNKAIAGLNQLGGPVLFAWLDNAMENYIKESGICR